VHGLPRDLPIREREAVRLVVRDTRFYPGQLPRLLRRCLSGGTSLEPLEVWP
jgi:hypothetical protein